MTERKRLTWSSDPAWDGFGWEDSQMLNEMRQASPDGQRTAKLAAEMLDKLSDGDVTVRVWREDGKACTCGALGASDHGTAQLRQIRECPVHGEVGE